MVHAEGLLRVVPNYRNEEVLEGAGPLVLRITAPAREGKAKERARKILAGHLGIPSTALRPAARRRSKIKIFEIHP